MHAKPWKIAVLRIRVHTHPCAVTPFSWEVLGTLQDVNWDRDTPVVFGAQSEKTYYVNAESLGLDLYTCMEYKSASDALATLRDYHELFSSCRATYDYVAEETYLATIAALGPAIHQAVTDNFPAWRASLTQAQPLWVGAPSHTPSSELVTLLATPATADCDLYV